MIQDPLIQGGLGLRLNSLMFMLTAQSQCPNTTLRTEKGLCTRISSSPLLSPVTHLSPTEVSLRVSQVLLKRNEYTFFQYGQELGDQLGVWVGLSAFKGNMKTQLNRKESDAFVTVVQAVWML